MTHVYNFLDLICPRCHGGERLNVLAEVWVRLTVDGTDADIPDNGNHDWNDDSPFECCECGHSGTVGKLVEDALPG